MKSRLLLIAGLANIILLPALYYLFNDHNNVVQLRSCKAQMSLVHNDFTLRASFNFLFLHGKGVVFVNGVVRNKQSYVINREISFDYERSLRNYLLKTTRIEYNSGDKSNDSGIDKHLPGFFIREGNELAFVLDKGNFGNPIMVISGTPAFFCQQSSDVF